MAASSTRSLCVCCSQSKGATTFALVCNVVLALHGWAAGMQKRLQTWLVLCCRPRRNGCIQIEDCVRAACQANVVCRIT
jgi:hypothetical protein